jgi:uncharacterized protein (DUF305 family)
LYALRVLKRLSKRGSFLFLAAATAASFGSGRAEQERPPIVQPGAPGQPSRVIPASEAVDLSGVQYTKADLEFMQGMISHHAQALEMTVLVPSRSKSEALRKLALRIELSQDDEIKMMQGWLKARGEEAPDVRAHHAHGAKLMPGMLTPEEMEGLADAKGTAFDRLFLELMIKHHQGALTMVENLLSEPGAGQDSDIFAFISDINADQSMEIARMGTMLKELSP